MATIQLNKDQSLTLSLSDVEREVFDNLPNGQLGEFISLWLSDKSVVIFKDQFARLPDKQKSDILKIMKGQEESAPVEATPVEPVEAQPAP